MLPLQVVVLALGAGLGVFYPFISVILSTRGFDPGAIGLVTALGAAGFTLAVPMWGHIADVRLGRARTLVACAIAAAAAAAVLLLPLPPLAIAAALIAFWFFESAWQPLADAISINAVARRGGDYSRIRVLTSLSFAAASIGAGLLYDVAGYAPAFILVGAFALVMAVAALRVPDVERADLSRHARSAPGSADRPRGRMPTWRLGSLGVVIRVAPRLVVVMFGVALVHVGVLGGFTFLPLRLIALGGDPSSVALSAGISAIAEIPTMLVAGVVARRIGLRGMFVGSALLYAVAIGSWVVLDSPALIIATRVVSGVAFAGIVISIVLTVGALLPRDLQATGQALYQTIAFGVAAIVANVLGGLVYGSFGHAAFFAIGAALALLAAAVGWLAIPARAQVAPAAPAAQVG